MKNLEGANKFTNREDMMKMEKEIQPDLESHFKERIQFHEALFDERMNKEMKIDYKRECSHILLFQSGSDEEMSADPEALTKKKSKRSLV